MLKKLFSLLIVVSMILTMTYIPVVAEGEGTEAPETSETPEVPEEPEVPVEPEEPEASEGKYFDKYDIVPGGWMKVEHLPCYILRNEENGSSVRLSFESLKEAVLNAEDGEVIILMRDVTESEAVELDRDISITINGAGYTVSFDNDNGGIVVKSGSLTLTSSLTVVASESAALYVIGGEVNTSANLKALGEHAAIKAAPECTGAVTVNGGSIEAEAEQCISWGEGGTLLITGGVFSSNPGDEYCLPGYKFELNDEGKYQVGEIPACVIGEVGYQTFADALAAAKDGDTITLLMDINEDGPFVISEVSVTIDGNGYTINCANGFEVSGGSLTLTSDLTVVASESAALYVIGGEVNTSANLKALGEHAAIKAAPECTGAVTVNGGSIEAALLWGEGGTLVIKGGVFSVNPDDAYSKYCLPGYKLGENGEGKYEIVKNENVVAIDQNGNVYETLAEALAAINEDGGVISLNKDVLGEKVISLLPGATIDLNGYVLGTEYITVYGGAGIIDGSADNSGLLKCKKENVVIKSDVTIQNKEIKGGLPVWDEANGGYIFTSYVIASVEKEANAEAGKVQYTFAFFTMQRARELIVNSELEDNLSVVVRISWTKGETTYYEDVCFGDNAISTVVGDNAQTGKVFAVTLSNYEGFENLTFQARIVSGTGMVVHTAAMAASAQ